MRISVCIATYRRPHLLGQLLDSLNYLELDDGIAVRIIVVDNDTLGSARETVTNFAASSLFPVTFAVEPVQNISLARNRGVALADGEYLAFVDDDEEVAPLWLASLLNTARSHDADAVFGPVISRLPDAAPFWIRDGGYFQRPRYITGTLVPSGGTGNMFIKSVSLANLAGPFDPVFGLTGGEDFDLCERLRDRGAILCWCDEAEVWERIGEERLTIRYLLGRALRGGQQFATIRLVRMDTAKRLLWVFQRSFLIATAIVATICSFPLGKRCWVRWLQKIFSNAGQLLALTRFRYEQYG